MPIDKTKCFGTKTDCKEDCELKACCIDRAREDHDEYRRNIYGDLEFNPEVSEAHQCDTRDCERQIIVGECVVPPELHGALIEIVAALSEMIEKYPVAFEFLRTKLMSGKEMSQSDFARFKGRSRQQIQAQLLRELNFGQRRYSENKIASLSPREFAVYKLIYLDGCTTRSAAKQLGIPRQTIFRVGQELRSKLGQNGTRKTARK